MTSFCSRIGVAFSLTCLAVLTRLLPHSPNFTAMGAVALVSGVYLGWRWASGVTVAAMIASDIVLGFYLWPVMLSVYGSLLAAAALGRLLGRGGKIRFVNAASASLAGSVLFYLATNWAVWQFTAMYPKTFAGLLDSYIAALPFFRNSLTSDLLYAGMLFGVLEMARLGQIRYSLKTAVHPLQLVWRIR